MERKYFIPVVNRVYTNRNNKQYRCTGFVEGSCPWETVAYFTRLSDGWSLTGFVEGSCPWETVAYFTRLSDGWSLAAHGPQIYEDGTIEWNYSTGGHWPQ